MSDDEQETEGESSNDLEAKGRLVQSVEVPPKKRRICTFREDWLKDSEFNYWLSRDDKSTESARCKICCCSFSVKTDGLTAVRKHATGDKHKRNCQSQKMSTTLKHFFSTPNCLEQEQITAAELAMTFHGVQHHHSYSSQACGNKLACEIFSDSKFSKKISCGKTKAEALTENILAPHSIELALRELQQNKPFSLATDASNKGNLKMYPISVRFFSSTTGVTDRLIDFYTDSDETADGITAKILQVLESNSLQVENLVSYCADNASVNKW